jgi:hypothetical protein
MAYTDTSFLAVLKPYVLQDMKNTGILASLTAAQAFIESNKGNSGLTQKANNLFGIKGTYQGQYVLMPTTEYYNGVKTKVNAKFRKYPNWLESIADHSRLFNTNKRYANLRGCTDYKQACINVQADGYATSPTYANTLIKTIEKHKLYEWDKEALGDIPTVPGEWNIGQTYVTQQDLNIRKEPNGDPVKYSDLTEDGQKHAFVNTNGYSVLKRGTKVTVKDIKSTGTSTWLRIPSGWICGKNSKNVFVL